MSKRATVFEQVPLKIAKKAADEEAQQQRTTRLRNTGTKQISATGILKGKHEDRGRIDQ
jgi:hypothetical protein